jgi:hypothetical protein
MFLNETTPGSNPPMVTRWSRDAALTLEPSIPPRGA